MWDGCGRMLPVACNHMSRHSDEEASCWLGQDLELRQAQTWLLRMYLMSTTALLLYCYYCLVPNEHITMMNMHTLNDYHQLNVIILSIEVPSLCEKLIT